MIPPDQLRPLSSSSLANRQEQGSSWTSLALHPTQQQADCSCCGQPEVKILAGDLHHLVPIRTGVTGRHRHTRRGTVSIRPRHHSALQRLHILHGDKEPDIPRQVFCDIIHMTLSRNFQGRYITKDKPISISQ